MPRDPETDAEWQETVDAAKVWVLVDSARQYGLVTGGPKVDIDRCLEILSRGRARGVIPSPDAVERFFSEQPA